MNFIPARESALFTSVFRVYTKGLFKRRFKQVWIHQEYRPSATNRTVYFLNHTSWWDGLIPFMLNEYQFHQKGRAMMELKQMQTYRFFKWLGAFSINPDDAVHTRHALRYTVDSMQRKHAGLYIYPEGEIMQKEKKITFKPGLGWLYGQLPGVDFVPIGLHIHTIRHDKPELHIWVGKKLAHEAKQNRTEITARCEQKMATILHQLLATAGFDDTPYQPFF